MIFSFNSDHARWEYTLVNHASFCLALDDDYSYRLFEWTDEDSQPDEEWDMDMNYVLMEVVWGQSPFRTPKGLIEDLLK